MNATIIIIFGLSGVGKTTLIKAFMQQHPQYMHLSASQMLREATGRIPEELRKSSADEIQTRQQLLAGVLAEKMHGQEHRPLLIDAHSVIDNDETLVLVPVSAIAAMKPTALIFYEVTPAQLFERRELDNRKRPARTIDDLARQQIIAKNVAEKFSDELKLPFYGGNINNPQELSAVMNGLGVTDL